MISSNFKLKLFLEVILICWLAIIFPLKIGNSSNDIYQNKNNQQVQQSSIQLNANDLQRSNILRIVKI